MTSNELMAYCEEREYSYPMLKELAQRMEFPEEQIPNRFQYYKYIGWDFEDGNN